MTSKVVVAQVSRRLSLADCRGDLPGLLGVLASFPTFNDESLTTDCHQVTQQYSDTPLSGLRLFRSRGEHPGSNWEFGHLHEQ